MTKWSTNIIKDTVKGKMSGTAASNVSFKAHPELLRQALFPLKQQQTKPAPQDGILFPLFAKHENMQNAPKPSSISQKEQPKGAKKRCQHIGSCFKENCFGSEIISAVPDNRRLAGIGCCSFAGLIAALIGSVLGIFFGNGQRI